MDGPASMVLPLPEMVSQLPGLRVLVTQTLSGLALELVVAGSSGVVLVVAGSSGVVLVVAGFSGVVLVVTGSSGVVLVVTGSSGVVLVVAGSSGVVLAVAGSSGVVLVVAGSSGVVFVVTGSSGAVHVVARSSGVVLVVSGTVTGHLTERRPRMSGSTSRPGPASIVLSSPVMVSQLPGLRVLVTQVLGTGRGAAAMRPRRRVAGTRRYWASILTSGEL